MDDDQGEAFPNERQWQCLTTSFSPSTTPSRSTSTRTSRCRRRAATRSPTSCATRRCATSAANRRARRRSSWRRYYRERRMMAVVFTVDSESVTGQTRVPNEEIAAVARANADVLIPFASIDPHKGRRGVDEARRLIAEHGVRGFKFHPNVQGFFPNDRAGLSALRGDRGGRAAGALPHRPLGRRLRPARRRRHPAQVLEPDPRRRRRGRLPRR